MYCSIEDLIWDISYPAIIDLVNDENQPVNDIQLVNAENIYTQRITEQAEKATTEIDGYLNAKFELPFNPIPGFINIICRDITQYYLFKRRFLLNVPDNIKIIYNERINQLKEIASGKIKLDSSESVSNLFAININKTEDDRLFSLNNLAGY